jgi:hypothetical protein
VAIDQIESLSPAMARRRYEYGDPFAGFDSLSWLTLLERHGSVCHVRDAGKWLALLFVDSTP